MSDIGYTVTKLSIGTIVFLFLLYLVVHYALLKFVKSMDEQKKLREDKKVDETVYKIFTFLSKWFPAIYVMFIVLFLGF